MYISGDSLANQSGQQFSAKDLDQDIYTSVHCAQHYAGAWWFKKCHYSHLNGRYVRGGHTTGYQGIIWQHWKGSSYSLKHTEMKIRPN